MISYGEGHSDAGRSRATNEDAMLVDNERGLYIVCDGMGGHSGGERASTIALEAASRAIDDEGDAIARARAGEKPLGALTGVVERAVKRACQAVYDEAVREEGTPGMGTTMTLLLVVGGKAAMGHVGDTRLYLARVDTVTRLSADHSLAAELEQRGTIAYEEMRDSPYLHVLTRHLGGQASVEVDTLVFDVFPGDTLLLCSDGLASYLQSAAQLLPYLSTDVHSAPRALVELANEAGGADDITAVAVRIEASEAEAARPASEELEASLAALRSSPLFSELSLRRLLRVLNACRQVRLARGEQLVAQGAPCEQMFILVEGGLEVARDQEVLCELGAPAVVGEDCLLRARPSRASLRASTPTLLLTLTRERFHALALRRPWLGVKLLDRLGKRVGVALEQAWQDSEASDRELGGPAPRASPDSLF